MIDKLFELCSSGPDGFVADRAWVEDLQAKGLACNRCAAISPDQAKGFTSLVVTNRKNPPIHVGNTAWLSCGVTLSQRLIDLLDESEVTSWGGIYPIVNSAGFIFDSDKFLLPNRSSSGIVRGPGGPPLPTVCAICGRLRYWPGPVQNQRYILRRYWNPKKRFTLLGERVVCEPQYFREVIQPLNLSRLVGAKVKVIDEPRDGLPADFGEMIKHLPRV
jgi:hypothetical protein